MKCVTLFYKFKPGTNIAETNSIELYWLKSDNRYSRAALFVMLRRKPYKYYPLSICVSATVCLPK